MLFNSLAFVLFFFITFALYYLPMFRQSQLWILVIASLVFYGWSSPGLLILLCISIVINAVVSFQVSRVAPRQKLPWATAGVVSNLTILSFFKYSSLLLTPFVDSTSNDLFTILLHLPLPIGISFYTFEGISLVVDTLKQSRMEREGVTFVARNPVRHLLNTSLFVAFFPHLIAGPILKARRFYPQIGSKCFKDINWFFVFRMLVIGYFLKSVVADNLKDYTFWIAYPYYQTLDRVTGLVLLFGYSIQIFSDFAGYSLIAIGLAASLGYELPPNFNFPYISKSIAEFWQRWHISLSSWLRDYLYIPLGGNRKGPPRTYINLLIVMILGGLWHGAAWSYMIWGCYHGFGLAIERFVFHLRKGGRAGIDDKGTQSAESTLENRMIRKRDVLFDLIRIFFVFVFVSCGWLLFKLPQISHVSGFLLTMINGIPKEPNLDWITAVFILSSPVVFYHFLHLPSLENLMEHLHKTHPRTTRLCYDVAIGLMLVGILLNSGQSNEFIYFQF